ncbi:MAG TPA: penicillin acylase family protein [Pseudomonadales bacterium]
MIRCRFTGRRAGLAGVALLTMLLDLPVQSAEPPPEAAVAEPGEVPAELGRVPEQAIERPEQSYRVAGLERPAEIVVDAWGVPHIYAGTHYDAFFVQGFNAARDRLWQIDLWRRRGLGLLSEVLGERYIAQDRAARLFLYRGDMYREWLAYGSDAKRIAEAFTAGINAYIDLIDADPALLPPEFELLGYRPSRWQPEDVVRIRSHGLWRNLENEVKRARLACEHGMEATTLWKVLQPDWQPRIPAGLDPCSIPEQVLHEYRLATAPVRFSTEEAKPKESRKSRSRDRSYGGMAGSNNWAVAPSRTATGRPILANDPHRAHAAPSLRYAAHLVAPGLNVIGAGEPSLPGISIGHNERIAFGLTIVPIDQEDLYVYERAGEGYRYRGRVEPYRTITETIPVRGEAPRRISLDFTRHGPVLHETRDRVFALRAAWLEPGMAPYFGSVEYMRAGNWREFLGALNRWGAPSENQVYADVDGNIGYKPAGLFPRRRNWDGLLPVPGDGRYEWDGYFDMDALPVEHNPARGFTGSANSMNLPPDYPIAERRIGFEWSAPWRYRRLWEVLQGQESHSLEDSLRLQRDYQSVLAREVIEQLPDSGVPEVGAAGAGAASVGAASGRERHPTRVPAALTAPAEVTPAGEAIAMLRGWNKALTPDSAPALLWALWFYRYLPPALAAALLPEAPEDLLPLDTLTIVDTLRYPLGQTVALETLAEAYEAARAEYGDPVGWRWGDLHRIRFRHPLLDRADGPLAAQMRYPSHPRGGSEHTTNNTAFDPADFLVRSGASWRMVLDVGNWDAARMTNAPGQSGDPRSPFYRNLLEGWAEDASFPLLYSREQVDANRVMVIRLLPESFDAAESAGW